MTEPSITQQVLKAWGATAKPLPTSTKGESDWLAVLDGCRLLIEEKTKFDNPASQAARQATFQSGGVHGTSTPLVRNNVLSGIVRKAASQLVSTGSELSHDLRVVWLTAVGRGAEAKYHQFIATLYGSTNVFELNQQGLKPCYFFQNSDFFRYSNQLDGAIAAFLSGNTVTMKLCLNPYSENWQALRDSPFAKRFTTGLVDPYAEEAASEAFVADTDVDRNDQATVLTYLQHKYKTGPLMNMDMNMASAEILVQRNERSGTSATK